MESFGLAIVEAMAASRAVVATSTEGAREIIARENSGILVAVGDYQALAASTLRLLEDGSERERLGALACEHVRSRFSLDRMTDATEQLYFGATNEKR
jgi:glycosyltransferase involved in cell wall biosynthesis